MGGFFMFIVIKAKRMITVALATLLIAGILSGTFMYTAARQPAHKTIYFTFDDGPSPVTPELLDVLKKHDVKATFFVIGQDTPASRAVLRRMAKEGHVIGLHTYTHNVSKIYRSPGAFMEDLNRSDAFIYEITGIHPKIFRFPGGSVTKHAPAQVIGEVVRQTKEKGLTFYDWNACAQDDTAGTTAAGDIKRRIIEYTEACKGSDVIVLLHDDSLRTTLPQAVEELILYFKDCGYDFSTITPDTKPVQFFKGPQQW